MARNILVAVDGSAASLRALRHALACGGRSAVIHVLNVEPPLEDYGMLRAYVSKQEHDREMKARAGEILHRAAGRAGFRRNRFTTYVIIGDVATTIVRTARRLRCDCIVMGARGMGAVGNLVLGSVSTKVIHLARVPVTVVK